MKMRRVPFGPGTCRRLGVTSWATCGRIFTPSLKQSCRELGRINYRARRSPTKRPRRDTPVNRNIGETLSGYSDSVDIQRERGPEQVEWTIGNLNATAEIRESAVVLRIDGEM